MRQVYVSLSSMDQVQRFVKALSPLGGDFELISGSHLLDARSLMGVFSLDLSGPILLKVYQDSKETLEAIAPFIYAEEVQVDEQ